MSWVSDCSIRVFRSFVTRHRPISVGAIVPSHISITHGYTTVNVSWLKHTNLHSPYGCSMCYKISTPRRNNEICGLGLLVFHLVQFSLGSVTRSWGCNWGNRLPGWHASKCTTLTRILMIIGCKASYVWRFISKLVWTGPWLVDFSEEPPG